MKLLTLLKRIKVGMANIYQQYISPLNIYGYGSVGSHSIIKNNSVLNKKNIFVDDWVVIQDQTNFISNTGKLIVGKYSVISSGCTIIPDSHRLTVGVPFFISTMNHINDENDSIVIEEDCWIGAGCILLPHCHICRGAVVGAGSVVKKTIPPYAVVVGAPAKIVATKFTIDQILRHESVLYPAEERMTLSELRALFDEQYRDCRSLGEDISDADMLFVEEIRKNYGMTNYANDKPDI